MDFLYLRLEQGAFLTSQSFIVLPSVESHDLFCFLSWGISTIPLLQLNLQFLLKNCNPFIYSITLLPFIWVQHRRCSKEGGRAPAKRTKITSNNINRRRIETHYPRRRSCITNAMEMAIKDLIGSWNQEYDDKDLIGTWNQDCSFLFFSRNQECRDTVEDDSLPSSSSSCSAPCSALLVPT